MEAEIPPLRIYLDTSVLGGLHDPEFEKDSKALFALFLRGEAVPLVSSVTEAELSRAPKQVRSLQRIRGFNGVNLIRG